jgi:hypothetical protein
MGGRFKSVSPGRGGDTARGSGRGVVGRAERCWMRGGALGRRMAWAGGAALEWQICWEDCGRSAGESWKFQSARGKFANAFSHSAEMASDWAGKTQASAHCTPPRSSLLQPPSLVLLETGRHRSSSTPPRVRLPPPILHSSSALPAAARHLLTCGRRSSAPSSGPTVARAGHA